MKDIFIKHNNSLYRLDECEFFSDGVRLGNFDDIQRASYVFAKNGEFEIVEHEISISNLTYQEHRKNQKILKENRKRLRKEALEIWKSNNKMPKIPKCYRKYEALKGRYNTIDFKLKYLIYDSMSCYFRFGRMVEDGLFNGDYLEYIKYDYSKGWHDNENLSKIGELAPWFNLEKVNNWRSAKMKYFQNKNKFIEEYIENKQNQKTL